MPTATLNPPTHREQQPARRCKSCRAWLRTGNESSFCSLCGTPPWEIVDGIDEDIIARISSVRSGPQRRKAFEAADELEALIAEGR